MKLPHIAFAALAPALLTACGSGASEEQLAQQVEIAKQAADRAVAAQQAAEAAAGKTSSSSGSTSALTGSGFRKDEGEKTDDGGDKFGAPTIKTNADHVPIDVEEPAPAN